MSTVEEEWVSVSRIDVCLSKDGEYRKEAERLFNIGVNMGVINSNVDCLTMIEKLMEMKENYVIKEAYRGFVEEYQ
jgi:hypothetical protein